GRIAAASSPGPSRTRRSTRVAPRRRMIRAIHACSPTSRRRRATGASAEHRLDLVEEALREGMDLFARQPCELLEQLALAGRQLLRRLHDDTHQLVAAPVAVQVRDALALQAEDLPRLGGGRDLHARRALERGHLHLGPEGGLRDADRHLADDVPSLAHEQGMLAHAEQHVEVARGAAVHPRLALAAELQTRAGVDPGGNLDVQLMSSALDTRAAARRARVGDDRPLPVAVAAGLGDREESLLEADLPRAAALRTRPRHRPGLGAAAAARLAGGEARHGDRLLAAEGRLLEADVEVVAEVLPATHPGAAARPARPEEVPEQVTDDVLEACSEVEARGPGALLEGGVPEAVVHRPPLRIREHLVR